MSAADSLIIVLGPQGSGKGTQVQLLSDRYQIPQMVVGELMRQEIARGSAIGQEMKQLLDVGKLATVDHWRYVVRRHLEAADLSQGLLGDGLVRTMEQVAAFEDIQRALHLPEPWVLLIHVPEHVSVERLLQRGRHDDTREAIERRLAWTRKQTQPVVEYYRNLNRVIDIDGNQSPEAVHGDSVRKLTAAGIIRSHD